MEIRAVSSAPWRLPLPIYTSSSNLHLHPRLISTGLRHPGRNSFPNRSCCRGQHEIIIQFFNLYISFGSDNEINPYFIFQIQYSATNSQQKLIWYLFPLSNARDRQHFIPLVWMWKDHQEMKPKTRKKKAIK